MKPKKTYYYFDALADDFAGTKITRKTLPESFKYAHKDILSRFFSWFLYWVFAIPILYLAIKLLYGIRIRGKKNLRHTRRKAMFFYTNHTQIIDAMLIQLYVSGPRRCYIVADQDATSIPGIRYLVQLLGAIPVPETPKQHTDFVECIRHRVKQKRAISIFPEAHIWPYYTHIRPFSDASFVYPAELNVPACPVCVTYRRRKFRKSAPPVMTVHIGKPVYPDLTLSIPERKKKMRDEVYIFMRDMSADCVNDEYIRYVKVDSPEEAKKKNEEAGNKAAK
ncbi:MAG: 1-acyl-sn-glycerol-3-phosphate acyltransferase [Bacilli bacterium]|nr:1-acyl-sn-glycerol-3-phosphate acyltransferase [Bacilli bacterium]